MHFRFRLGPFTFGPGGTRLSLWKRGTGVSIPLSGKKGRSFGKVGVGPVNGFFGGSPATPITKRDKIGSYEGALIEAFGSDRQFLKRLQHYGIPWRGVQERIKEELPERLSDRDNVAYKLVPIVMDTVFGPQNAAWGTEKRPSKRGKGLTTWIVIINNNP